MAADIIDYQIFGDDMQLVEIELDPGEGVRAEAGAMMYMEQGIVMETGTGASAGAGVGAAIFKGLKRAVTGESFFITTFFNNGQGKQHVAFGAPYPGKIIPINLASHGGQFIAQKDSYLCSANGIDIEIAFTRKIGAGLFGGEGFILQKLKGDGLAFIHAGGTIVRKELRAGEMIKLDTGCLAGMDASIKYDIQFVGGFKNALFGGEGLFLATLTGPGVVYLQSLPLSRLADRISAAAGFKAGNSGGETRGIGGILGGMISGD
ncbi:hypothetical protein ASZ90_019749 [hydrocarbon metagenome]|uniref:DUF124 domain-containing protein n=1 Tax=hydrocarbon metagenome TaxID=938273 RepID=A0A0W8E3G5_9ZZZZ